MKLGGSLTRQKEEDMTVSDASPHVANIGSMIEVRPPNDPRDDVSMCVQDMENSMRNTLNEIYFGKTKDIVNDLRFHKSLIMLAFCHSRADPLRASRLRRPRRTCRRRLPRPSRCAETSSPAPFDFCDHHDDNTPHHCNALTASYAPPRPAPNMSVRQRRTP